ncbi:MAG TPA: glucose-1-phosphate cytidylyltransferase [Abditibacterium sp.]|jgi:glucose-1-phosphate cytidylyltransferase
MKTVILCGGQGTRLREETEFRPKPLVEVGSRPILWHIMKHYQFFGYADFVLCLGYRGGMIKDFFLNYEAHANDFTIQLGQKNAIQYHDAHGDDFRVTCAETGLDTMTGGRLKRVARHLGNEPFFLTYGDGLSNVDIQKTLDFHRSHGKLATVTIVRAPSRFGTVSVDETDSVTRFVEKPLQDSWVSAGFFVLEPQVLDLITGDDTTFEREPLETLANNGELMAYRHDGVFLAIDTYREYLLLNEAWKRGEVPWKVW